MTTLLLLLAPVSPTQPPPPAPVPTVVEVAPMPSPAPTPEQVAAWVADLSGTNSLLWEPARTGLVKAGTRAKSAVPALIKAANSKDGRPDYAIQALGAIGPDARDALPMLRERGVPSGFGGFGVDNVAVAIARIDAPRVELTHALLLSSSKGTAIYLKVSQYLREFPAAAVSHLVELCGSKDATVRVKAATVIGDLRGRLAMGHETVTILQQAGESAKAIPAALEKLLADEDVQVRLTAAQSIAYVAPELSEKCIPVVIAAMTDRTLSPKTEHYQAAHIFAPVPEQAATALIPMFGGDDDRARHWAIHVLAHLRVQKRIEEVLKNGATPRSREAAALCLGTGHLGREVAVPPLTAALGDRDFAVRFAAARGVVLYTRRGEVPAVVVPVLVEGLNSPNADVMLAASKDLVETGDVARAAVPDLVRLLGSKNPELAAECALALVSISPPDAAAAVPVLVRGLAGGENYRFARALAVLGPTAKDAVPELLKQLDAKHPELRLAAAEAAARIDPTQAAKAVAAITPLLTDPKRKYSYDRGEAAMALARIGGAAKDAVPTLVGLSKDKGPFRAQLALAAAVIDPDGTKEVRGWILKELAENGEEAYDLAEALPELGRAAKPLLPELLGLLNAKTPFVREGVVEALGGIGPDAAAALPALKGMAEKEKSVRLRKYAADAVKKIEAK